MLKPGTLIRLTDTSVNGDGSIHLYDCGPDRKLFAPAGAVALVERVEGEYHYLFHIPGGEKSAWPNGTNNLLRYWEVVKEPDDAE